MNTPFPPQPPQESSPLPMAVAQQLRQAALRRNLRTAAVLGIAVSGALVSSIWLAATAGGTFVALTAWRCRQQQKPGGTGLGRS